MLQYYKNYNLRILNYTINNNDKQYSITLHIINYNILYKNVKI